MKQIPMDHPRFERRPVCGDMGDALNGFGYLKLAHGQEVKIIFSCGEGWDHVSVSRRDRAPTWDEMCQVKAFFFAPEERVVQYHPKESEYVNLHPNCLHLWRWQGGEFPAPPTWMIR